MGKIRKPLSRSILLGTALFVAVMCAVMSVMQYSANKRMLFGRYEEFIKGVLNYIAADIDEDDLAQCIKTGEESEKYHQLQRELDTIKERLDIHFIYAIVPVNTEPNNNIRNVIAGATKYEYEHEADELVKLNTMSGTAYSSETARKYMEAYRVGELAFFEEVTQWGHDYTGMMTLFDSNGNRVAALCVDVDITELYSGLRRTVLMSIAPIVLLGLLFLLAAVVWARKRVTQPILELDESVSDFADACVDAKDPAALKLEVPDVRGESEVAKLAGTFSKMGGAVHEYVQKVQYAEHELSRMIALANKDALTMVRNKNAFDAYKIELNSKMQGDGSRYAILMADLNGLEKVNEEFGHDKGDQYIVRNCRAICEVFDHSPVFRVGGDEFVVVLLVSDFENRAELLERLRKKVRDSQEDASIAAWEKCSVAVGVGEYRPGTDDTVEDVLRLADKDLYSEKERIKRARGAE